MFPAIVAWPLAAIAPQAEVVLRVGYGALLLLQLAFTWPNAFRFYSTEKYGGYVESLPRRSWLHGPRAIALIMTLWTLCALALISGFWSLPAAILNLIFARYFFVHLRWRSILRGLGAPGHMNHWIGALLVFLLFSHQYDFHGLLHAMTVITFRIDFAGIMIAAGIYKIASGYARGDGFERGLVNPWWGFWWKAASRLPADSWIFRLLNHLGYVAEIGCGIAFLIPPLAPYAAVFFALSFLMIGALIRLTFLAEMVALCCALYITPQGAVSGALATFVHAPLSTPAASGFGSVAAVVLAFLLAGYVLCLPFAYAGMAANFYAKRRLPRGWQKALDYFSALFGLMLWRVFTADLIHFYADMFVKDAHGSIRPLRAQPMRFWHVGEFITLASLFTTLKYYPHDRSLFQTRIVRYARSMHLASGDRLLFRYTVIEKENGRFEYHPVAEFEIDPLVATVCERILDHRFDVRSTVAGSPVSAGSKPGTYAPAGSA